MMDQDASSAFLFFNPSYWVSNEQYHALFGSNRGQGGALCCHLELPAVNVEIMSAFQTMWRAYSLNENRTLILLNFEEMKR